MAPKTEKIVLTKKQKRRLFQLIKSGGSKREVEVLYFKMTNKNLKQNSYKWYRKLAKQQLKSEEIFKAEIIPES